MPQNIFKWYNVNMYTAYIDLDGTLLDDRKLISQLTYNSLVSFQQRGNNLVLATARSRRLQGLQNCLKEATPYFILHNGGEILSGGKVIWRTFFDVKQTRAIGAYLTSNGIKAAVITESAYYANYDAPAVWGPIAGFIRTNFSNADFCAPKFTLLLDNNEAKKVTSPGGFARIEFTDDKSTAIISPAEASKGAAVKFMQEQLFVGSTSIFIGNDNNDFSGFEACNIKVAVANACNELLAAADIVIGDNNHDGVAHYLNTI